MKLERVKDIANAVLYEGYLLYPYRHSALKNRQRWTFGVVYPQAYSQANGELEPWQMQTECLVTGLAQTSLDIHVRFLHLLLRSMQTDSATISTSLEDTRTASTESYWTPETWEEGVEREVSVQNVALGDLCVRPRLVKLQFPAKRWVEPSTDNTSISIVREQQLLAGVIRLTAEQLDINLYKLRVCIENRTPASDALPQRRDAVLLQSFISTHTILRVYQGTFVSSLDPPAALQTAVQTCQNVRTWPVLVGSAGDCDVMLSSPIILYDYPQIAPESVGTLFDGTEIDEILTLRILTLTDAEKREMCRGDARARDLLERTEALSPAQLMQLHGTLRAMQSASAKIEAMPGMPTMPGIQSVSTKTEAMPGMPTMPGMPGEERADLVPEAVLIAGQQVTIGSRVRLRPAAHADAFDLLLAGKTARVEAIQQDFEQRLYLVVTVDDDPGREQWDERILPGHRFFFYPAEIEPLEDREGVL